MYSPLIKKYGTSLRPAHDVIYLSMELQEIVLHVVVLHDTIFVYWFALARV